MMKLQYCSDLHLEFFSNREWLEEHPIQPEGDILILAGDTSYLGKDFSRLPFLDYLSSHFKESYLLPGNHEYYGGYDVTTNLQEVKEALRHNVWLVNNTVVEKPEVRMIFTTLWSRIVKHVVPIENRLVDFRRIRYEGKLLSIRNYNQIHEYAMAFLERELQVESPKKQLVVTHHLPSELCNAEEFKGSVLNEAFCVELTSFIKNSKADAWIYGHSHRNIGSFKIGNTHMLTNQLGYVDYGEHKNFRRNACIEL